MRGELDKLPRTALELLTKPRGVPHQAHTYSELRQQIHDDLGFNIPNGSSLLANVHCVTLTRRA